MDFKMTPKGARPGGVFTEANSWAGAVEGAAALMNINGCDAVEIHQLDPEGVGSTERDHVATLRLESL